MAAATESEICDCVLQLIWVTEKQKLFRIMKYKGAIFILNHRVPLVPLFYMFKNVFKIWIMDNSEKKKKVALKNIFQTNLLLTG